jgi:hypothetical protein
MWNPWKKRPQDEKFSAREVTVNPAWVPPPDLVFQYLLERSAEGAVPVYFGSIPLARVRPFSESFHPENTPGGPDVVEQIMERWRTGDFKKIWVYERGNAFICSDDYFTLAAVRIGQPDFVPAWILGRPIVTVKDLQGPITVQGVRKMLNLTD